MDHSHAVTTLASERYMLGEMSEAEREAFEEHYFSCPDCAEDVRAGGLMEDGARAGFAGVQRARPSASVVQMPPPRARPIRVVLPWAVAATFALAAGYQGVILQQQRRGDSAPVALTPVTLRPATRGAEPVVSPSAGVVTLAADLADPPAGREIDYQLRTGAGALVASGRVAAPPPGSPLLLMVPLRLLTPSEHYVLSAKNPGSAGLTLGDYRFTVGAQ